MKWLHLSWIYDVWTKVFWDKTSPCVDLQFTGGDVTTSKFIGSVMSPTVGGENTQQERTGLKKKHDFDFIIEICHDYVHVKAELLHDVSIKSIWPIHHRHIDILLWDNTITPIDKHAIQVLCASRFILNLRVTAHSRGHTGSPSNHSTRYTN